MAKNLEKAFTSQVEELKQVVNQKSASKAASKSNSVEQEEAQSVYNSLGAGMAKSPREMYATSLASSAISVAAEFVAKFQQFNKDSVYSYSFEAAQKETKDFTLFFTTSEESAKKSVNVGTKTIYLKEIAPDCPDNVLRSYESCKLYFEAVRIETAKEIRAKAKFDETIKLAALALGVSPETLLAMKADK